MMLYGGVLLCLYVYGGVRWCVVVLCAIWWYTEVYSCVTVVFSDGLYCEGLVLWCYLWCGGVWLYGAVLVWWCMVVFFVICDYCVTVWSGGAWCWYCDVNGGVVVRECVWLCLVMRWWLVVMCGGVRWRAAYVWAWCCGFHGGLMV